MRFNTGFFTVAFMFSAILYAGDVKPVSEEPKSNVKAADIAATFNISADSVDRLKTTYSIGYGGISKAFALAEKSGLSVDEILRMKTDENLGWGEIARKLELKPGSDYKAGSVEIEGNEVKEAKMEKRQSRMENRAEKKSEKMERKMERSSGKGAK
jgi:hypothetical protein